MKKLCLMIYMFGLIFNEPTTAVANTWQAVYQTDRSSDPRSITNSPSEMDWDSAIERNHLKPWDMGEQYPYVNIPYSPGVSYKLGFNVEAFQMDWAADVHFGLGNPSSITEQLTPTCLLVQTRSGVIAIDEQGTVSPLIPSATSSHSISFKRDEIYLSDATRGGDILAYNFNGELLRRIPTPSSAYDYLTFSCLPNERFALFDNVNDMIYFIDNSGKLIATRDMLHQQDTHLQNICGIVVGEELYISEDGNKNVLKVNLHTYEVSVFRNLNSIPSWLGAINYVNGEFYTCCGSRIYRFTEHTGPTQVGSTPSGNITGIGIIWPYAYVSVNFTGEIYGVDLTSGERELYVSGLNYPVDLVALCIPTPWIPVENDPPVADAGDDLVADANEEVTLDASASYDLDGDIIQYTWKRIPDEVVIYSGKEPTCQTRALGRAEEVIEVTITDNNWARACDTLKIINRIIQDLKDQIKSTQDQKVR